MLHWTNKTARDDQDEDVEGNDDKFAKIGKQMKLAILATGQAGGAVTSFTKVAKNMVEGGSVDWKTLAKATGVIAMEQVTFAAAVGTAHAVPDIEDAFYETREAGDDLGLNKESQEDREDRQDSAYERIDEGVDTALGLAELMSGFPVDLDPHALDAAVLAKAERRTGQDARKSPERLSGVLEGRRDTPKVHRRDRPEKWTPRPKRSKLD